MTNEALVEAVARAIYDNYYPREIWPTVPFDVKLRDADDWREIARAAIEAYERVHVRSLKEASAQFRENSLNGLSSRRAK